MNQYIRSIFIIEKAFHKKTYVCYNFINLTGNILILNLGDTYEMSF